MSSSRLVAAAAGGLAVAVVIFGVVRGTWAVGGSDSSCYALMADAFARGDAQPTSGLAIRAPWPDASRTLAPAGFIPSPIRQDAASPVCAPGFSVLLTPLRWLFGRDGIFGATPLAGGLVIWLAFVIGRHLAGPAAGVAGAIVTATMPVLLFQVVQPMNDVLGAALWLSVIATALLPEPSRPWAVGAATGLAVLVRPNLAPVAIVVVAWVTVVLVARDGWSRAVRRALLAVVIAAVPSAVLLVWLNATLYGHPLHTGYGSVAELFSTAHIRANLANYGSALWATERAFPLLGVAGVALAPARHRALALLILAVAIVTAATYVLYRPFPEWWYLRFLLPALVPMSILGCAAVSWIASRIEGEGRVVVIRSGVTLLIAFGLAWFHLSTPAATQAFDLQRFERRFRTTGELVRERFSERAVFITVWQSGTLRYHAGRDAILWDSLAPDALEPAVRWLATQGFEPYILTEEWEEPAFRQRFGFSGLGALDWPPRFAIERQVRIYSPADRPRYRAGEDIRTEFVIPR